MNQESQIGGHGFDSGLSQSLKAQRPESVQDRETDDGRTTDRLQHQQSFGIPLWDLGIRDSDSLEFDSPDPKRACTPNKLKTLVSCKHTSKASHIAFCCCVQWVQGWVQPLIPIWSLMKDALKQLKLTSKEKQKIPCKAFKDNQAACHLGTNQ